MLCEVHSKMGSAEWLMLNLELGLRLIFGLLIVLGWTRDQILFLLVVNYLIVEKKTGMSMIFGLGSHALLFDFRLLSEIVFGPISLYFNLNKRGAWIKLCLHVTLVCH